MNPQTNLSTGAINRWIQEVEARITVVDSQLKPLHAELTTLQHQRSLLNELLGTTETSTASERSNRTDDHARPPLGRKEPVRDRVHREVVEILSDIGVPIHIRELTREYKRRGYKIPGQGKPANILVHLSGWDDIVNPERGIYALASPAWDAEAE